MAEDIIIRYRAETDEFLKELNVLIDKQDQLADEAEKTSKSFDKSATNEVQAAKRRQQAIEAELKNIERLKQARARAFDPVLIDRFNRQIQQAESRIKSLSSATDKEAKKIVSSFNSAGSQIKNIGLGIAAGFGAAFTVDALVNFGRNAVDAFSKFETLQISFKTFLGDAELATSVLDKLNEFSVKTPFTPEQVQQAGKALLAFGITVDDLIPSLQRIGDLSAGTGKDFNELAVIFGKARTQGVLFAEDINQLTEAGIPIIGEFAKQFGVAESEVKKLGSQGKITFKNLEDAFKSLTSEGGRFNGLINELSQSTAGQLSTLRGEFNQFLRDVGGKVAPVLISALRGFTNFFKTVSDGFAGLRATLNEGFDQQLKNRVEEVGAEVQGQVDSFIQNGISLVDARTKALESVKDRIFSEIARLATNTDEESKKRVQLLYAESEALKVLQKQYELEYATEKKLNEERAASDLAKRIEEQKKLTEIRKKEAEERAKIDSDAFEQFKRNLLAQQDELLNFLNETERKAKERELLFEFEVRFKAATEGEDAALEFAREKLFQTYQEELQSAELTSNTVEEANAKKQKAYEEYIANSEKLLGGFSIFEQNNANDTAKAVQQTWIERNEEILRTSLDLFQQLSALSNTFTQQRIEDLNLQLEKVREVEEAQLTALEESKEKRLISEADYEKRSESIKQQRIASEKKIQAEISKQKRKQAIIDKTSALFEIALNTAIAIMKVFAEVGPIAGVPLASLTAALGAAQAATVLAQPIPAFAKGTKGKKGSGMALVGEQGAEMTFLPDGAKVLPAKQTKTYGEVFDAMYDNRFEKYVMQKYVAPALEQQRKKFEGYKQESFTKNIVNSMQYNGITTGDLLYANSKGTKIKNADEIAYAIAKALKTQSPDLWRM